MIATVRHLTCLTARSLQRIWWLWIYLANLGKITARHRRGYRPIEADSKLMTKFSQSPRDRILWILTNSGGKLERSRLRRCAGMRYASLNPIQDNLAPCPWRGQHPPKAIFICFNDLLLWDLMSVMYHCSLESLTKEHLVLREAQARLIYGALVSNLVFQKYQQSLSRLMEIPPI
jgi:hypothetical protein